ncbi:MAG: EAL domain-containing response regulator [Pseudomonadota bacterium]|nr:EAL domain-containing response regulator [Pseudomonadota bacterium]
MLNPKDSFPGDAPRATGRDLPLVLVVEDNRPLRSLYSRVLKRADFEVDAVSTGAEAEALVTQGRNYSAIVSDLWLADETGLELATKVREEDPDVPFVLITGSPTVESAIGAIERGVHRYLCKPVAHERFVFEVREAAHVCSVQRMRRRVLVAAPNDAADRQMDEHLDDALEKMWLAAQPIVRGSTTSVYAHELLLRTTSTHLTNPLAIIAAAERQHRIADLGRRVRTQAALRAAALPPGQRLFINLHPAEVLDPDLCHSDDPLVKYADRVTLEVTERARLDGVPGVGEAIARLRHAGYQIALDDLGCGYAGLSSLATLSPDVVKLDMSLIRGIDRDAMRSTLVRAMVDLCRQLGIVVIGEGVETRAERDTLGTLGCDLLQGYLFGRPDKGLPSVDPSLFR